jgi:SAM-dependent methyltransferase
MSAWGPPPSRFYQLLRRTGVRPGMKVAVIGCSDGRFVLPLLRRRVQVTAIDVDAVALWGGPKMFPYGMHNIIGLAGRARCEELQRLVTIREIDLAMLEDDPTHDLVFTSGSLHYSRNHSTPVQCLVDRIVAQAKPGAFLYIDYMLPVEEQHNAVEHYLKVGVLRHILQQLGCNVLYDHYSSVFVEKAHVDNPKDHVHKLGYVLARVPN